MTATVNSKTTRLFIWKYILDVMRLLIHPRGRDTQWNSPPSPETD
jgi:hypothetical protein